MSGVRSLSSVKIIRDSHRSGLEESCDLKGEKLHTGLKAWLLF